MSPGGHGVVIAGAGLAGVRTAQALRRLGYDGRIRLLSDENEYPYDRPPLSKDFLTGKKDAEAIRLRGAGEYGDDGIDLMLRTRATGVDPRSRTLRVADGTELGYDWLVVATGARPRVLPALPPGPDVHYLRTADDARRLSRALLPGRRVAVVGGGFIGLEVAAAATSLGCAVSVVEMAGLPLAGVIGPLAAQWLLSWHSERTVRFYCGCPVSGSSRASGARRLLLGDGSHVDADVVVVGAGIARETDWLTAAGLEVHHGLVCDLAGRASLPGILGAGDIACLHAADGCRPAGHWTAAGESAARAARTIARGGAEQPTTGQATDDGFFWSDQGSLRLQFAGQAGPGAAASLAAGSFDGGAFVVHYVTDGRMTGVFAANSPREFLRARIALRAAAPERRVSGRAGEQGQDCRVSPSP
jgi:3-phenylpropionate/trans-cinnamate dioxygenase ferredoxin reductase component